MAIQHSLMILCVALSGLIFQPSHHVVAASLIQTSPATPTITATVTLPEADPAKYRLRVVPASEMLQLSQEVEQNLKTNRTITPDERLNYEKYRDLLQQETLRRFPNLENWTELYQAWVYKENYLPTADSFLVDNFVSILEQQVNLTSVKEVEKVLTTHEFKVISYHLPNLFGTGQAVEMWYIEGFEQSLLVVLTQTEKGHFHLVPLTADWVEHYFGKEAIDIADYNGDGQTEISSIKTRLGHAGCYSEIALYHWRDQKLINLTSEIKPLFGRYIYYECDDPHIWRFEPVRGEAAQVLVQRVAYNSWVEGCPTYPLETRYRWNGETSQVTNAVTWQDFDPTSSNSCALAWATLTMEHSPSITQSAQAVAILTQQLTHWSATLNTIWGPAAEDYWRFKLATWQAKQGDMALAKATMQTVRDKPTHPEFKMVAHLADLFLQEYDGTADYQLACWVTIHEVTRGFEAFEQEANHDNDYVWQTTQQEWGFSEPTWLNLYGSYGIANPWDMCDFELGELSIKDSITQYVRHQQPHNRAELVAALQRKGINVEASQQVDLTGDGKLEDVILMTYDDVKQPQSLWAVQYADSQVQLNPISIISRITGTVSITLEQFQLSPTLTHVNLLATDNQLIIFQLNRQGVITEFFSTLIKPPYTFDPTFPPKVTFLRSNNAVVTYSWYIKEQKFLDTPPKLTAQEYGFEKRPEQLKAELKRLLFDFPYQASAIDQAYLSLPLRYDSLDADLIYLIGLAYELHGDDREAVKAYWSLWQKYPQSPFTLVVRKKLAEE